MVDEEVFKGGIRELLEGLIRIYKKPGAYTDQVNIKLTTVTGMNATEDLYAVEILSGKEQGWLYTDTSIFMFGMGDELVLIMAKTLRGLVEETHKEKKLSKKIKLHHLLKTSKGKLFGFLSEAEIKDNAFLII